MGVNWSAPGPPRVGVESTYRVAGVTRSSSPSTFSERARMGMSLMSPRRRLMRFLTHRRKLLLFHINHLAGRSRCRAWMRNAARVGSTPTRGRNNLPSAFGGDCPRPGYHFGNLSRGGGHGPLTLIPDCEL